MAEPEDFCRWCALPFLWDTSTASDWTTYCSADCERYANEEQAATEPQEDDSDDGDDHSDA